MQGRTHNCGQLKLENAGEKVTLVGWFENIRKVSKNLGFVILRDFYGTTQIVVETEDLMEQFSAINTESTIEVTGTVRERSSKNPKLATGDIEVVPETVKVLGKCQYQELPFQINRSKEADENTRLKYRYLDLRNPEVKSKIVLRSKIVADLRSAMVAHDFMEITTPILTCSSPEGARDYLALIVISRLLLVSEMRMREQTVLRVNSISWIWKWHLPIRKMSLLFWKTFFLRFLQSMVFIMKPLPLPSNGFPTERPWRNTAPISQI